ncbi:MAG: phosphorylcholine transferase LicD [Novosphingobium sp.]
MTRFVNGQASENLQRLQQVLCGMTAQLFGWCRSHDITMVLVAGSALGAVRHGAIIPWDDDIDLGMQRSDFDRFVALFQRDPVPGMKLQFWPTEPDYPYSFAKVRLEGTRIEETDLAGKDLHAGIFVDIFPFDDVPANPLAERVQRYAIGLLNLFIERPLVDDPHGAFSPKRRAARRLARWLAPVLPAPQHLARLRDSFLRMASARKSDQVDCLGMFGTNASNRTRIARAAIFPPVPGRLGQIEVLIPADSETYLTRMYRDWRKLPPEDQRLPIHVAGVDFGDHPLSMS